MRAIFEIRKNLGYYLNIDKRISTPENKKCLHDKDELEYRITRMFLNLLPKLSACFDNRQDSLYIITDKKGKDLVYIVVHFAMMSIYWATDSNKEEFSGFETSFAIEYLDLFDGALLMSIFEGAKKYFSVGANKKYVIELGVLDIMHNKIIIDTAVYGRYVSMSGAFGNFIRNQIEQYDLIPKLAEELVMQGINDYLKERKGTKNDI